MSGWDKFFKKQSLEKKVSETLLGTRVEKVSKMSREHLSKLFWNFEKVFWSHSRTYWLSHLVTTFRYLRTFVRVELEFP